jgi:hypothetical protein
MVGASGGGSRRGTLERSSRIGQEGEAGGELQSHELGWEG